MVVILKSPPSTSASLALTTSTWCGSYVLEKATWVFCRDNGVGLQEQCSVYIDVPNSPFIFPVVL